MPTSKPRYTVTDVGRVAELLDTAQRLYSARTAASYVELDAQLSVFHQLRIDSETIATALTAQRDPMADYSPVILQRFSRRI